MGCIVSCKRPSSPSNLKNIIRVVHLNGYMEEFDYPVTVGEVTGSPPRHFLFTQAQLLAPGSSRLKFDALLEPGCIYFMLPYSLFDSNVSPVDLAPIARKLAATARKSGGSKSKTGELNIISSTAIVNSRVWSSPGKSPDRIGKKTDNGDVLLYGSAKSRSWKPILATIRERSFNRRSESDLQDSVKIDSAE